MNRQQKKSNDGESCNNVGNNSPGIATVRQILAAKRKEIISRRHLQGQIQMGRPPKQDNRLKGEECIEYAEFKAALQSRISKDNVQLNIMAIVEKIPSLNHPKVVEEPAKQKITRRRKQPIRYSPSPPAHSPLAISNCGTETSLHAIGQNNSAEKAGKGNPSNIVAIDNSSTQLPPEIITLSSDEEEQDQKVDVTNMNQSLPLNSTTKNINNPGNILLNGNLTDLASHVNASIPLEVAEMLRNGTEVNPSEIIPSLLIDIFSSPDFHKLIRDKYSKVQHASAKSQQDISPSPPLPRNHSEGPNSPWAELLGRHDPKEKWLEITNHGNEDVIRTSLTILDGRSIMPNQQITTHVMDEITEMIYQCGGEQLVRGFNPTICSTYFPTNDPETLNKAVKRCKNWNADIVVFPLVRETQYDLSWFDGNAKNFFIYDPKKVHGSKIDDEALMKTIRSIRTFLERVYGCDNVPDADSVCSLTYGQLSGFPIQTDEDNTNCGMFCLLALEYLCRSEFWIREFCLNGGNIDVNHIRLQYFQRLKDECKKK